GHGERHGDLEERCGGFRVEVASGFEESGVEPLEGGVDGESHEGDEVVGEAEDDGGAGAGEVLVWAHEGNGFEGGDDDAFVGEYRLPGEGAEQEADEEGGDDEHEQQVLQHGPGSAFDADEV